MEIDLPAADIVIISAHEVDFIDFLLHIVNDELFSVVERYDVIINFFSESKGERFLVNEVVDHADLNDSLLME